MAELVAKTITAAWSAAEGQESPSLTGNSSMPQVSNWENCPYATGLSRLDQGTHAVVG